MGDVKKTYGSLALAADGKQWIMADLAPHVSIKLKAIFSRVPKHTLGPFNFPRDPITEADLDWFISRYPMAMSAADRKALTTGRLVFEYKQAEMEQILLPDYRPPMVLGLKEGQSLRNYQGQAVELIRRRQKVLVGDEGGLGKTYIAAAALCAEPRMLPAAVVCDAHMQKQWKDKIEAFTTLRVHLINKGTACSLPPADVYIYRVSQIAVWIEFFATDFFKAVIYDEPQSLRTGTSTGKGASARVLSEHTCYHVGLTATPIYNYGVEMYNIMKFIDDAVLGDYYDFVREWVKNDGKIRDPKALGTYLREQHAMIRRLRREDGSEHRGPGAPISDPRHHRGLPSAWAGCA